MPRLAGPSPTALPSHLVPSSAIAVSCADLLKKKPCSFLPFRRVDMGAGEPGLLSACTSTTSRDNDGAIPDEVVAPFPLLPLPEAAAAAAAAAAEVAAAAVEAASMDAADGVDGAIDAVKLLRDRWSVFCKGERKRGAHNSAKHSIA